MAVATWSRATHLTPTRTTRGLAVGGLTMAQRRAHRGLVALWLVVVVVLLAWWLRPAHVVDVPRLAISTVLLGWTVLVPAWGLFFVGRQVWAAPSAAPPSLRVAMVVTKAPSEPWPVVRRTLEGMLAQGPAHDTWLADEQPDEATRRWCAAHGVRVSSRQGVADYHRPSWPRRTRCKEGNLAYFYDTVAYDAYDVVVQLDADHVPSAGYLEAMLRPFRDPAVGYVSAPSICDANAASSWAARARAWAEAPLHGALQAGLSNGFAPLCIGSHYAVRTSALQAVGGLGPELAEDHSTTLLLNAGGWRGMHAMDAVAHGDGPESFGDLVVQEFQWSRSLVNLLLGLTPRVWGRLPAGLRVQFAFSQLWYPMFGLAMLASVVLPIVALATATPWMRVSYVTFLAHGLLLTTILLTMVAWLQRQGWLRPVDAPVLSWEAGLFHLMRWPWVLAGCAMAVGDTVRGTAFPFRVTPKGGSGAKPLPLRFLAPHLLIAVVSLLAVLVFDRAGAASGYHWFALGNGLLYAAGTVAVVLAHVRENAGRAAGSTRRDPRPRLAFGAAAGLLLLAVPLSFARADDMVAALTWLPAPGPAGPGLALDGAGSEDDAGTIDTTLGTVNLGIHDGYGEFGASDRFAIGHEFVDWADVDAAAVTALADAQAARGRWLLLTAEPHPRPGGEATLLADVAAGAYDDRVDALCRGIADASAPVLLRWGHEMENVTGRYPWAVDDGAAYAEAFRHVATRCRSVAGEDVYMVWSPVGEPGLRDWWPGVEHVDVVGLSLFDFPAFRETYGGDPDATFAELFTERYDRVVGLGRPVIVAEMGTTRTGADKVRWLNDALASTPSFPSLDSFVFFHGLETEGVWGDEVETPVWRLEPEMLPNGD